jgi:predicted sulfurtransferase
LALQEGMTSSLRAGMEKPLLNKKEKKSKTKEKKESLKRAREISPSTAHEVSPSDNVKVGRDNENADSPKKRKKSKRSSKDSDSEMKLSRSDGNDVRETITTVDRKQHQTEDERNKPRPLVESSALPAGVELDPNVHSVSLLLFYQYVEPPWTDSIYKRVKEEVYQIGTTSGVSGRMRVAKEGLNCTLTGTADAVRQFCHTLRTWKPEHFNETEFKLTHHLVDKHKFNGLKVMPVTELVHYGLEGDKAPPIQNYSGEHLEPAQYHEKLADPNTVIIDVRNHYEAAIGRFAPPNHVTEEDAGTSKAGPLFLDPKMRKSTEFPVWLDSTETKEKLKGKQVLMYCTGGIRCERASALLKYKMETDPSVKELGIQGVYQLQGGIDKYFKEFPDGGYWKGKNYTFDKRFAHAPVELEEQGNASKTVPPTPLGKCEACSKPWDKYRGKRRCPTCGVPSLICKECYQADQEGTRKLGKWVRCDLCAKQGVQSKKELREKEHKELAEYENRIHEKGLLKPNRAGLEATANPDGVTRLYLKNMCRTQMTEDVLVDIFPDITHIVWRLDGKTGNFFGQGWVEVKTPTAAASMVARSGEVVLGRPLYMAYQAPDGKDAWPPPKSAVQTSAESRLEV